MARRFDRTLEQATDQTLVEPNWEQILECVDLIRGGDVPVKSAIQSIQKRYRSDNPHVAHHALLVLEACVKNCGKKFHTEIATREFMDDLKNLVIEGVPEKVKEKVLELLQCWASAFEKYPEYKIVGDTTAFMKMYGYEFPRLKEADAMFMADSAPEWAEGTSCFRCRVEFGMFTRKHHCRSCGQAFCDRCSNRQMMLPQFGIEKKVRVCETCFTKLTNQPVNNKPLPKEDAPQRSNATPSQPNADAQREAELKDEEELQMALAISLSEAEERERGKRGVGTGGGGSDAIRRFNAPPTAAATPPETSAPASEYASIYSGVAKSTVAVASNGGLDDDDDELDPALSRYLDRRYWEQRHAAQDATSTTTIHSNGLGVKASAPPPSEMSFSVSSGDVAPSDYAALAAYMNNSAAGGGAISMQASASATPTGIAAASNGAPPNAEYLSQQLAEVTIQPTAAANVAVNQQLLVDACEQTSAFCAQLKDQVDTMNTRMRSNILRGRSLVNDSPLHSLFTQLVAKHEEVLSRMANLDAEREYYERLQDHLANIQDARQALDALREEHRAESQARQLEAQRIRQQQMQQKLASVRRKKHDFVMENRNQALQRFQEQDRFYRSNQQPAAQQQQETTSQQPETASPTSQQQESTPEKSTQPAPAPAESTPEPNSEVVEPASTQQQPPAEPLLIQFD